MRPPFAPLRLVLLAVVRVPPRGGERLELADEVEVFGEVSVRHELDDERSHLAEIRVRALGL